MAREYGRIRISIADDEDLEDLTTDAQWLYFRVMVPDPSLNYAGVGDWRPTRLLRKARDMTLPRLLTAAAELEQRRYALFDVETEEFLCRTLIRSDELLKNPKMAGAVLTGYSKTASRTLRAAVVTEIQTARKENPDYSSWTHKDTADALSKTLARTNLETVGYTLQIQVPNTDTNPVKNTYPNTVGNTDTNPVQNTNPDHTATRFGIPIANGPDPQAPSNINITRHQSTEGGYVSTEGHQRATPDDEPPTHCPRHPGGTDAPCRACGDARQRHDTWATATATDAKTARRNAIDACEHCDPNGIRHEPPSVKDLDVPAVRCDHTPMSVEAWHALAPADETADA